MNYQGSQSASKQIMPIAQYPESKHTCYGPIQCFPSCNSWKNSGRVSTECLTVIICVGTAIYIMTVDVYLGIHVCSILNLKNSEYKHTQKSKPRSSTKIKIITKFYLGLCAFTYSVPISAHKNLMIFFLLDFLFSFSSFFPLFSSFSSHSYYFTVLTNSWR